jgi:hypothetical protein
MYGKFFLGPQTRGLMALIRNAKQQIRIQALGHPDGDAEPSTRLDIRLKVVSPLYTMYIICIPVYIIDLFFLIVMHSLHLHWSISPNLRGGTKYGWSWIRGARYDWKWSYMNDTLELSQQEIYNELQNKVNFPKSYSATL